MLKPSDVIQKASLFLQDGDGPAKTIVMMNFARQQYAIVQRSRGILFGFLQDVVGDDGLNRVFGEFDNKSIRDLLEHTPGFYFTWIGYHALGRQRALFDHEPCNTSDLVRRLFARVDETMDDFLDSFKNRFINGRRLSDFLFVPRVCYCTCMRASTKRHRLGRMSR